MSVALARGRDMARAWWRNQPPLLSDALLYALSAVFALGMGVFSGAPAQWHWGYMAVGPYALVAVMALVFQRRLRDRPTHVNKVRIALAAAVVLGAVLVPLAMEVHWRTEQPEVSVLQRAAINMTHEGTPYLVYWEHGRLVDEVPHLPAYESFFPYFVGMTVFGLPAVVSPARSPLSDARIWITLMTLLVGAAALWLMRAPPGARLRVAQVLVALPTGALFLATGGDDMPILALGLLGVVALQRRSPHLAGVSLGLAAAMKFTGWPLALAAVLVARDRDDRPAWRRVGIWVTLLVGLSVVPFAIGSPFAFLANVVAFPLGLAHVASPAASPLPGHLLTMWWAPAGHVLTPLVMLVGGAWVVRDARAHWPLTTSRTLGLMAVWSTVLICAASATRVGYVIYPINFALWSKVCADVEVTTPVLDAVAV